MWAAINNLVHSFKLRYLRFLGVPKHVAFIMDGNRRWSKKQNLPRVEGHRSGFNTLNSVMKTCFDLGIKHMTVYAFSLDNFKRSLDEVNAIMQLALAAIQKFKNNRYFIFFL